MNQKLFSEFKKSTDQDVWTQIHKDLKGLPYDSTLTWESSDGIKTQPFYDRINANRKKLVNSFPQQWKTSHTITLKNDIANSVHACEAAKKQGVEIIIFRLSNSTLSIKELVDALEEIDLTFYVIFEFIPPVELLIKLKLKNWLFLFDPITQLAQTGNWLLNQATDLEAWSLLVNLEKSTSYIYIDNRVHQNAGATIPQQLSYALSQSVDYLSRINSSSEAVEVVFHLALGPNYFFEIAKIQALKTVFSAVLAVYDFKINYKVIAEPSERNLTLQDYNINMLRSTTAMMAGILGGADVLNNLPYDIAFNTPNEFGDRIAQNQLLILKKESFFDQVTNPAEGSYYIEQLTQEFAEYALTGFKEIESKKGFLSLLLVEEIQKQISKSAQKEQDLFDSGALVLVGINRFQDYDAPKTKSTRIDKTYNDKMLIEPIRGIRLSEKTEQHNGK